MQDYLWIVQEHHGMRGLYQEKYELPNEEDIQIWFLNEYSKSI